MPLVAARCKACSQPLSDPPHIAVPMRCAACGFEGPLPFAADGQPAQFDAAFTPNRLAQWFAAARVAMARGAPGIAVGHCARCQAPLVVSSKTPVRLPCPHCQVPVEGLATDVLVDQWCEPWARASGEGVDLEYRLALVEDGAGQVAGCAHCGLPSPPGEPGNQCKRCRSVVWVTRGPDPDVPPGQGWRVQLGVRVNGTRFGRPFAALVPIVQGEHMLRVDAAIGSSSESGKSLLGLTGIGCAIAVTVTMIVPIALLIGWLIFRTK
jgi:hypothetical protein